MPEDIQPTEVPVTPEPTTEVSSGIPVVEEAPAPVAPPKYLTEEEARKLVADLMPKTDWRKQQSETDREQALAAAHRRARQLEEENRALTASFKNLAPEAASEMELTQYRTREATARQLETEDVSRRAVEETVNQFYTNLSEYAKEVGIDPTHKGLDWGQATEPLTVRQNKFLKSAAMVQKAQNRAREDSISQRLKDETAKMRKELGLESVDRTPSVATGSSTDFLKKFANGDIPMTKENITKYNQLLEE